jgi:cytidylate kinase
MQSDKKINIAIDGYSSCGKSTLAKGIAQMLHYAYIDTGAMYRAVTLYCMRNGYIKDAVVNSTLLIDDLRNINIRFRYNIDTAVSETFLNGENVEQEIRKIDVSDNVSRVSEIKEVRKKLVSLQQMMGKEKGVVMDGRDIGTVVFPDAEIKIFMTADTDIRMQRRFDELIAKGHKVTMGQVKENLLQRDFIDSHRKEDPLIKAEDAVVLDNSLLTREEQLDFVLQLVDEKLLTGNA